MDANSSDKVTSLITAQLTCTGEIKWIILFFKVPKFATHVTWIINKKENKRYTIGQPVSNDLDTLKPIAPFFSSHLLYLKEIYF